MYPGICFLWYVWTAHTTRQNVLPGYMIRTTYPRFTLESRDYFAWSYEFLWSGKTHPRICLMGVLFGSYTGTNRVQINRRHRKLSFTHYPFHIEYFYKTAWSTRDIVPSFYCSSCRGFIQIFYKCWIFTNMYQKIYKWKTMWPTMNGPSQVTWLPSM